MQLKKCFLCAAGLFGVIAIGALSAPKLSAAIKAAFVEVVMPSKPFSATLRVPFNIPGAHAVGPEEGTLGVTNLILTNLRSTTQRLNIFQPVMSPNAADCGGPVAGSAGPGSIFMIVELQPNQTLSLPFPTPLVFKPIGGHSCIAVIGPPDEFQIYVTGFVN